MTWAPRAPPTGRNVPVRADGTHGVVPLPLGRTRYFYNDPQWEPFLVACEDLGMQLARTAASGPLDDPAIPASFVCGCRDAGYARKAMAA